MAAPQRIANPAQTEIPGWYAEGLPHAWLPYCQMQVAPSPLPVAATEGCRIRLADGRELVDGISSWWTACHGYNHPHIARAVEKQLKTMPHVMFGGLAHEPALVLAARLSKLTGLERVFFADSGSIAVEVALKIALQYWRNRDQTGRDRFLCFSGGYHGDTFGAMSVSDPARSMHKAFQHTVTKQYVADIPADAHDFSKLEKTIKDAQKELAGVIIEPLVQGAGGMRFHSPEVLAAIHKITKKYGLLLIADEIATGFGRTGTMFACEQADITPDIMCVGKALTGGTITLAATLASAEIFSAFLSDDRDAALMHGPTYMANPLACAAANASLDLFEREPRLRQVAAIEAQLKAELEPCRDMEGVVDVRVKGAIGVVQLEPGRDAAALRPEFIRYGVWIRPFGDIVYLMPPFVITREELGVLTGAVKKVLSAEC